MKHRPVLAVSTIFAILSPVIAQQTPTVKTSVDEVILDLIVRDKKGKPVADLKPEDITVSDNGNKQELTSFRLVRGAEAISSRGEKSMLDPLRQLRLVTLAFDALGEADQRKTARTAANDLVKGSQGTNVFYSVVAINTQLMILQPFTTDKAALVKAIETATAGLAATKLSSESDSIKAELKRTLGGQSVNGADQDTNVVAAAGAAAAQTVSNGSQAIQAKLASVALDMLRMDQSIGSEGTRLSITALASLVQGMQSMPGRKSVLYFTAGMSRPPELDKAFDSLLGMANRANVTFYSLDTRGVMTASQNAGAISQLNGASAASRTTITRTSGAVTKDEVMSSDNAESSMRANPQTAIRDLAESTGGFLIGDSNDLRTPLREVNEEIASYYELSYKPGITTYDGSFRSLKVTANRKDLVIHSRNGYFALPAGEKSSGVETFEMPLLKSISGGASADVPYRARVILLRPKAEGADATVLVEVPLHGLQSRTDEARKTLNVHFSLLALVKDSNGEVVQKLSRDRSLQVTPDQLKLGNFVEKMPVTLAGGKYKLDSAVMDRENNKVGVEHSEVTVEAKAKGVGISSLTQVRSYTPNAKGLDPNEVFQFQGGSITPTLNTSVAKTPDAALRLFFTVYRDPSIAAAPSVEIEFLLNGNSLTKVPMALPAPDSQGRIPYVMTIPAASIPPGNYEVKATAKQGDSSAETKTMVQIEAK